MKKILFVLVGLFFQHMASAQWQSLPPPFAAKLYSISFVDENTGFISGENGNQDAIMIKTTNGGLSWSLTFFDEDVMALSAVCFVNSEIGYTAGYFGAINTSIFKTADGGTSWKRQLFINNAQNYTCFDFINPDTGYVVGNNIIRKTIDGGLNWVSQPFGTVSYLSSVDFINADSGYAVGVDGRIIKTINGGATWVTMPSTLGFGSFMSVCFVNQDTGFMVGYRQTGPGTGYSLIYKTTDGARTITPINTGSTTILRSVFFTNENTGYIAGTYGKILKTVNGGETWTAQNSGTTEELKKIFFVDSLTGFAIGLNTILKTTNGGIVWVEDDITGDSIILYPNPANSSINVELPSLKGLNTLIIINLNGYEVFKIQLRERVSHIDISHLKSGVYFAKVIRDQCTEVIKLIKE